MATSGVGAGSGSATTRGVSLTDVDDESSEDMGLSSCTNFGGHSRFSLSLGSSFAESPVFCALTIEGRGAPLVPTIDCRFVCCSNRPMRFATLARGRSSGSGLADKNYKNYNGVEQANR